MCKTNTLKDREKLQKDSKTTVYFLKMSYKIKIHNVKTNCLYIWIMN